MITIGKLAKMTDSHVETIRYYQRIGLLRIPIAQGKYRYYNEQDIETLNFIHKGKEAGLQNQLKDLDKGLKDVNRSTEDNSPAAVAQKQQQLQKLQKDVSRLQSSLGYDE